MKGYKEIIELLEHGPLCLSTILTGPYAGEKMVLQDERIHTWNPALEETWKRISAQIKLSDCPCRAEIEGLQIFTEYMVQEPELIICGGGHVSLELSVLADYLEYPYTIIDDRAEFVSKERFPRAKACICQSFEQALSQQAYSGNVYYIIVTRGHAHDLQCLENILNRPFGYVGMIGSKGKVKKSMNLLAERGYPPSLLSQVYAPIGINIGGETPKEIAVSIMAQLIEKKNAERPSSYVDGEMKQLLMSGRPMVLARIIEKHGSAPRGIGSRMAVDKQGIAAGTIGGGTIEFEAEKRAILLAKEGGCMLESYQLNSDSAAALGMWCGGGVTIFFESI